jgi:transcriptional regulator with XRE-family HTH domain
MAAAQTHKSSFAAWMYDTRTARGLSVRGLAKAMSRTGDTQDVERHRRNLNRYIHNGIIPTDQNKQLIADALGVSKDEMPADEDEEAAVSVHDLFATLLTLAREHKIGVPA